MPRIPEVYSSVFCPHSSTITSRFLRILAPVPWFVSHAQHGLPPAVCLLPSAVCLLLLLSTQHSALSTVHAQSATATLSGTVVDQNDDVVPDVKIAVISIAQGFQRSATTREQGTFVVPLLPPGNYTVKAERHGFTPAEVRDVVLNVNDQVAIRIQIKVGSVSQTVEIVDSASLINESPAVATVVDRQFVANLPLNGRSFQSLITLSPGVVLTKSNAGEQGQFSVNGQRANANYFTVDGVSANVGVNAVFFTGQATGGSIPGLSAAGGTNNLVSVDALQEFRIQTSTYAPEFGRSPGAQVSIVTRSGTNDFRGTLFEYFRNDALDANDFFANSIPLTAQQVAQGLTKQKRAPLRQNDFGGVFGGPLYLPRFGEGGPTFYGGKHRTFFFFSYEGLRLRQPTVDITDVPSLAARQAAPATIRPFLNAFPFPTGPANASGFAEFASSFSNPTTLDATSIRVDHRVNDKLALFGRYNHSPSETITRGGGFSLNTLTLNEVTTQTLTLGATSVFTPAISNEFKFNYSRNRGLNSNQLDNFGGATPPSGSILYPSPFSAQDAALVFFLQGGRRSMFSVGSAVDNLQRQVNVVNNLSVVAGSHQFKFGIDYRRLTPFYGVRNYDQIAIFTGVVGAGGAATPGTALSGRASSVSVSARDTNTLFFNNFSAYGQDTWKPTRRFNLNYGLRWDVNPAPRGEKALLTVNGLDNPSTLTLAPEGTGLYETTYNNIAPRIGVAYLLSQKTGKETVLRGGFGIFYDLGAGSAAGNAVNGFPSVRSRNFPLPGSTSVPFPLSSADATPPAFDPNQPIGGIFVYDRNARLPRVFQWNVAIEQSLGSNQTVTASYVAAIGRRLLRSELLLNPNQTFQRVTVTRNTASSDYHAMQLQFERRFSRGFQALASYTWAHSIDTASNDFTALTPSEKIDPQSDRGPSDFDVRHAVTGAITYNFPSPDFGSIANAPLKGWAVDTTFTARSATPVNITYTRNIPGIGSFPFRPDLDSNISLYINAPTAPGGRRINDTLVASNPRQIGPFIAPPATDARQGTLGRNSLRGFSVYQIDMALRRQFNLTERVNLQFRAEFFNLFNHPNFADPNSLLGSFSTSTAFPAGRLPLRSGFGFSPSMLGRSLGSGGVSGGFNPLYQIGGPRSIQFALKLNF